MSKKSCKSYRQNKCAGAYSVGNKLLFRLFSCNVILSDTHYSISGENSAVYNDTEEVSLPALLSLRDKQYKDMDIDKSIKNISKALYLLPCSGFHLPAYLLERHDSQRRHN